MVSGPDPYPTYSNYDYGDIDLCALDLAWPRFGNSVFVLGAKTKVFLSINHCISKVSFYALLKVD